MIRATEPRPHDRPDVVDILVVGAGVSGLSFANWIRAQASARAAPQPQVTIIEAADQPGGYCRTVIRDGFVWDYSGHFFHFARPEIEAWLRDRMPEQEIYTVVRKAAIRYRDRTIDFPFQSHIHQLDQSEFIDCLVDLHAAARAKDQGPPRSFKEMLQQRLGRGIAERFLIPYNQKLYACDLDDLEPDAMRRFFPHADLDAIIANMRPDPERRHGYNATFVYPAGGAIQFVHALLRDLPADMVCLEERLLSVDLERRIATTSRRRIAFSQLVSSAPLPDLARACGLPAPATTFSCNKVVVFNLGFDRRSTQGWHWMYFPDPQRVFYRVGWYDNILGGDRMSLYVEIGVPRDATVDIEATLAKVLVDLASEGIIVDHQLVAWHHVVLDPAYVYLTSVSMAATAALRATLACASVYSVGRYGGWTYCSIEDNLVETRELAAQLAPLLSPRRV